jgi:hypothetical protein
VVWRPRRFSRLIFCSLVIRHPLHRFSGRSPVRVRRVTPGFDLPIGQLFATVSCSSSAPPPCAHLTGKSRKTLLVPRVRLVDTARLVSRRFGQRRSRRDQYNDNDDDGSHLLPFTALRSHCKLRMNLCGSVAQRVALGFGLVMAVADGISAWLVPLGTKDPPSCACGPRV